MVHADQKMQHDSSKYMEETYYCPCGECDDLDQPNVMVEVCHFARFTGWLLKDRCSVRFGPKLVIAFQEKRQIDAVRD